LKESLEKAKEWSYNPQGVLSDLAILLWGCGSGGEGGEEVGERGVEVLLKAIEAL
jgi:DNA mismatch repair protein MSH6